MLLKGLLSARKARDKPKLKFRRIHRIQTGFFVRRPSMRHSIITNGQRPCHVGLCHSEILYSISVGAGFQAKQKRKTKETVTRKALRAASGRKRLFFSWRKKARHIRMKDGKKKKRITEVLTTYR